MLRRMSEGDLAALLKKHVSGWDRAMDLELVEASGERVVVEWSVAEKHLQPFGIVHGGVHCGVIEAACSIGAGLAAAERGDRPTVVGLENHTSFIRAVREGRLRATALPITRGRSTQVWEAHIRDTDARVVATGRVRLMSMPQRE